MLHAVKLVVVLLVACGAAQHPRPTRGTITGIARDHDSGEPIANAQIRVRVEGNVTPREAVTAHDGTYAVGHLAPGRYSLSASFAGQPIDVENIDVRAGTTANVDLSFTLGRPDPVHVDFVDPKEGAIDHYRPQRLAEDRAVIEGTVNDQATHGRVPGAVVTVYSSAGQTLQAVTDDAGHFWFETYPGTYAVSAYYSIGGRGEIEVRRMDVHVAGGEAAVVPLWIEIAKQ